MILQWVSYGVCDEFKTGIKVLGVDTANKSSVNNVRWRGNIKLCATGRIKWMCGKLKGNPALIICEPIA